MLRNMVGSDTLANIVCYICIGLNQEGIYRINGNTKLIESLRTKFNQEGDADLDGVDIYSVGNLLKLFLVSN